MYCALPPSLKSVLEFAKVVRDDDPYLFQFLDAFLKGLSTLGTAPVVLSGLRRHLQFAGTIKESAEEGANSLESLLRQHDLLLGPDLGGFANLLRSAIDDQEVFNAEVIDFESLDADTKARLGPIGDAVRELSALDDVCDVFSLRRDRVATCIVMDALSIWVNSEVACAWMRKRDHLESTLRLFEQRNHLEQMSADFLQRHLPENDLKDFSLWYLSRLLSGRLAIQPFERRLADTMLKKAELGSLATFENVGFHS